MIFEQTQPDGSEKEERTMQEGEDCFGGEGTYNSISFLVLKPFCFSTVYLPVVHSLCMF